MDENGYPDEEELKTIREWPEDYVALMDYIHLIWHFADWGWRQREEVRESEIQRKFAKFRIFEISTGGWSGNEEIIGAMLANFVFWNSCWVSSHRGGHYVFEVPVKSITPS